MKIFKILMLATLMSLPSCAIKRKTKEVEKLEAKQEQFINNDSVFNHQLKVVKTDFNQTLNEFESVLKALNVQYDGEQGNDLKVSLNRTENGTELNVSGKGKANYNEQSENTYNLTKSEFLLIYDSLRKFELAQNKLQRDQLFLDHFKSNTEKEKSDVSIWIYVVIGSVLVVGTALYIGIRQIKK